ncbi:CbrC family protein [Streptomyces griseus]|uniref:CbrC family protein n=1 Tax=Streptomyces griseus TaxID=1911 RepID=UPI000565CE94|nr:CbrC family protein [Streptomyces griseus]
MTKSLPAFPYHPHPVATGSVVAADGVLCVCCGTVRGYVYAGPVYAVAEPEGRLCPWCIADGSAAARYGAHFCAGAVGDDAPREVLLAIAERTPGFSAWQDPQWLLHCGDGAAFLGRVGAAELADRPDAVEAMRREITGWGWPTERTEHYLGSLDKDGQPTAYLFRCRVCSAHLATSDFT